jgi:hypothetical protein
MVSGNTHGCKPNAENGFGFERYHKDGDEFLNHIVQVTGDKTYVSFVNVETEEQPEQWMHMHSPNKPKKFKQTLSAGKLVAAVFWARKGVQMVEFMQQGTTITSKVHCETLKNMRSSIQDKRHGNAGIRCSAPP